jgi:hypothetical protein
MPCVAYLPLAGLIFERNPGYRARFSVEKQALDFRDGTILLA